MKYGHEKEFAQVILDVTNEVKYAQKKWGKAFDKKNNPNDWVAYIVAHVGAAVTMPWNGATFRKMMVEAAGLCMSAVLWHDIAKGKMPKRHYDKA